MATPKSRSCITFPSPQPQLDREFGRCNMIATLEVARLKADGIDPRLYEPGLQLKQLVAIALGERLNLTNDPDGAPNIRHRRTTAPEQQ